MVVEEKLIRIHIGGGDLHDGPKPDGDFKLVKDEVNQSLVDGLDSAERLGAILSSSSVSLSKYDGSHDSNNLESEDTCMNLDLSSFGLDLSCLQVFKEEFCFLPFSTFKNLGHQVDESCDFDSEIIQLHCKSDENCLEPDAEKCPRKKSSSIALSTYDESSFPNISATETLNNVLSPPEQIIKKIIELGRENDDYKKRIIEILKEIQELKRRRIELEKEREKLLEQINDLKIGIVKSSKIVSRL